MKILIACEFSGIVRDAFAKLGHDVTSCDLEPSLRPGKHYVGDVRNILYDGWDMMIAFPPCTHLAISGARHFESKYAEQEQAIEFFRELAAAPIARIALENPVGIMSSFFRKPDQIIHPWKFGHSTTKATCLWLKDLLPLKPTNIVDRGNFVDLPNGKRMSKWYYETSKLPKVERARARNTTFQGVADAMAAQWG